MSVLLSAILLQYVISVKAGMVNHVQGSANVKAMENVRAGHSIKTGADGYAEILLRPGSFLRLGENSEAVLSDTDLASVKVTILHGPALVEAAEVNKNYPITVTTGNLTTKIATSGLYRFENGVATVLQGRLQAADGKLTYEKGWQVFYKDNLRARKSPKSLESSLDVYSQSRSGTVAMANLTMASTLAATPSYSEWDLWLFSQNLGFYTYIPRSDFRSPYGYRYYAVPNHVVRNYSGSDGDSGGSSSQPRTPTAPSDNAGNSGGGAAAPAPTASTPSGQTSTPAVYVDSKNTPVGATNR